MSEFIPVSTIRVDGGTQPRATIDFEAVFDYSDAMTEGARFPPVVVFYDGDNYWLADGFHRVRAAEQAGLDTIACELHQGTQEDAQWYSFSANKTNGLRRTNDDKHRAVKAALIHPKGAGLSDRQIAIHVGVDHKTVAGWREKFETTGEIPQSFKRAGRDGRTIDVRRIGSRPAASSEGAPEAAQSACGVCGQLFGSPVRHCAVCGHHWPAEDKQCRNCHQHLPLAHSSTGEATLPHSNADVPETSVAEWCNRVHEASLQIAECPVAPIELAAAIRRNSTNNELRTLLEKTRDFLTAILAATVVD